MPRTYLICPIHLFSPNFSPMLSSPLPTDFPLLIYCAYISHPPAGRSLVGFILAGLSFADFLSAGFLSTDPTFM